MTRDPRDVVILLLLALPIACYRAFIGTLIAGWFIPVLADFKLMIGISLLWFLLATTNNGKLEDNRSLAEIISFSLFMPAFALLFAYALSFAVR